MNKILILIICVCASFWAFNWMTKKDDAEMLFGRQQRFGKDVVIVSYKRVIQDEAGNDVTVSYWDEDKFKQVYENAKKGEVEAQAAIGYLYLAGKFVGMDYEKAEFWLKKAAEANDSEAQFNLAYLYHKQDKFEESLSWYKKSAELGYSEAQLNLALLLTEDAHFNLDEAIMWFKKAIENGNRKAYFPLAWWYLNELELNKEEEGLALLKIAAEDQDPDAEFMLGELYETGDLVEKDLEKSKILYKKASFHGSLEALEKLKQME